MERLLPPWEKTRIISRQGGIDPGGRVELKMHGGPIPFTFRAHHVENVVGKMFRDVQEKGPFSSWSHTHHFFETPFGSTLKDEVLYRLPLQQFLPPAIKRYVETNLLQVFHHRKNLLLEDIKLHLKCSQQPLRILISGASGILGRELIPLLSTGGHQVWTLVRRNADQDKNEISWDPENDSLNPDSLPEIDCIIHLAGEYIGLSRWSEAKKSRVIESRVRGTTLLAKTAALLPKKPRVFLCASAVGYYGNSSKQNLCESEGPGTDFISKVCDLWERASNPASDAGIRTVLIRLGVGLTPRGGALEKILTASPFGYIRRFGSGAQHISWISSDDMISAMLHCLTCTKIEGPINIAAPEPVSNEKFMQTLSKISGRPLLIPVSAKLLKLVYGQMASEILLSGSHVSTKKLQDSGFQFRHPNLEMALRRLLGKDHLS